MTSRLSTTEQDQPGWNYGLWRSAFHEVTAALGATYVAYNQRVVPASFHRDRFEEYWALRRGVVMTDVSAERTTQIAGPDAQTLMDRVMPRKMSMFRAGRAMYGILCRPDGGILCDGVLLRPAADRFWYVGGQGDAESWFMAHATDLDVLISDPDVSVVSIQGPKSLQVLDAVCDAGAPEGFDYFCVNQVEMGGQRVVVSRTGWTGELGFEVYLPRAQGEGAALWRHIEQAGAPFGIIAGGLDAMDIRRIEAGILLCGADIDTSINPFQAGLGDFIDMNKAQFVGKQALLTANRTRRVHGVVCGDGEPIVGSDVFVADERVGWVTAAAFSPHLEAGTAIMRSTQDLDYGAVELDVAVRSGGRAVARPSPLPMYDAAHRLVRGLEPVEE